MGDAVYGTPTRQTSSISGQKMRPGMNNLTVCLSLIALAFRSRQATIKRARKRLGSVSQPEKDPAQSVLSTDRESAPRTNRRCLQKSEVRQLRFPLLPQAAATLAPACSKPGRLCQASGRHACSKADDTSSVRVADRGAAYRKSVWTNFDPKATPYTREQVIKERSLY